MTSATAADRTVLVTGASTGIGLELARVCARHGHALVLVARRGDVLTRVAGELSDTYAVKVHTITADLSEPDSAERVMTDLQQRQLHVDMLVNNAGVGLMGEFHEASRERLLAMIDLNVRTLTDLMHHVLPGMVERGWGRVLNVASVSAFQPGPGFAVYHATKAYVLSLSEAVASELDGSDVCVSVLCPGVTRSGFMDAADMTLRSSSLLDRVIADPADVAEAGYRGMVTGRRVIVPGVVNKGLALGSRLGPRRVVTSVAGQLLARGTHR